MFGDFNLAYRSQTRSWTRLVPSSRVSAQRHGDNNRLSCNSDSLPCLAILEWRLFSGIDIRFNCLKNMSLLGYYCTCANIFYNANQKSIRQPILQKLFGCYRWCQDTWHTPTNTFELKTRRPHMTRRNIFCWLQWMLFYNEERSEPYSIANNKSTF